MILKFFIYFQVAGTLSVLAWIAAVVLMARYARRPRRTRAWALALLLAVAGAGLARWNYHNINIIRVDRSEEEEKARLELEERKRREAEEAKANAPAARFAEETAADLDKLKAETLKKGEDARDDNRVYDAAVRKQLKEQAKEDAPAEEPPPAAPPAAGEPSEASTGEDIPSYRGSGKKQRQEGKTKKLAAVRDTVKEEEKFFGRMLPEAEKLQAVRWGRFNLFFSKLFMWLALLLVVVDYLSRFNRTFDALWPMPIAGRWLDNMYPKTHSVILGHDSRAVAQEYLRTVAKKGETFIYFGKDDPLPESRLPRYHLPPREAFTPDALCQHLEGTRFEPHIPKVHAGLERLAQWGAVAWQRLHTGLVWLRRQWTRCQPWLQHQWARCRPWLDKHVAQRGLRLWRRFHRRYPKVEKHWRLACLAWRSNNPLRGCSPYLRKLRFDSSNLPSDNDFVFESAWFHRYGICVLDAELVAPLIEELGPFLRQRRRTGAAVGRSVNIVWDRDEPIPEALLADLVNLCADTNFKLLAFYPPQRVGELGELFEEAHATPVVLAG